jgi:organic hydroperoxide reductase OsmC/OhrA
MTDRHHYEVTVTWTGNTGSGTSGYRDYSRAHEITAEGKAAIAGSSDPVFRGDKSRWSPEELLVASLSACHKLWYLHLCSDAGLVVTAYCDHAEGTMRTEAAVGMGSFTEVVLRPEVTFAGEADLSLAKELHAEAHKRCFIANSVSFPVRCEPVFMAVEELVADGR